jgi:hypothetical protein
MVSNVADLAGNMLAWPVIWSFPVADYGADDASVRVSGYMLFLPYTQYEQNEGSSWFINSLVMSAYVPPDRFTSVTAYSALDGQATVFSFTITPLSSGEPIVGVPPQTAVTAAQTLARSFSSSYPFKVLGFLILSLV